MIVLDIFIIFLILILVINFFCGRNKLNYQIGNAQFIGTMESQNDYFLVKQKDDCLLIALSDGLTDKSIGRKAAVTAVKILGENFNNLLQYNNKKDFFKYSYGDIQNYFNTVINDRKGAVVLCSVISKNFMEWSSMGNCALFLFKKNELIRMNPTQDEVMFGKYDIKKKDILLFCTQGTYDCLTEADIISILSKKGTPFDKAQQLSKMIINKAYAYQKNATIIVLEWK